MNKRKELEEQLNWLKIFYETRRGYGHSTACIEGVLRTGAVLVVATHTEGHFLDSKYNRQVHWMTLDELPHKLKGLNTPLVIDHHAFTQLVEGIFKVIRDLENEIYRSNDVHRH